MTERILIMRHASGLVNRARRLAIQQWPTAKLEVHDLAAYGKPPADFRWDRYAQLLIDDEYLRREGLLWLSELRSKPGFPKIVRVPGEVTRHRPRAEIEVKSPPLPAKEARRAEPAPTPAPAPAPATPAAEAKPVTPAEAKPAKRVSAADTRSDHRGATL